MVVWNFQLGLDFTEFNFPILEVQIGFDKMVKDHFDEQREIGLNWKPIVLISGEPRKETDFIELNNSGVFAISQKGFDFLTEERNCSNLEFLPFQTDLGTFYVINNLNLIDCLDHDSSEYSITPTGVITKYRKLAFHSEKLEDQLFFKIPELPYTSFFTINFKDCYHLAFLKGIDFDTESDVVWSETVNLLPV